MILDALERHRGRGVLIDANLLVLYLVGHVNRKRIANFRRTQSFTLKDFDLLVGLVNYLGPRIVSTPHVLSQTSDLTKLNGDELRAVRDLMKALVEKIEEQYDPAKDLVSHPLFARLGLGDAGIATVCSKKILVLTTDLALWIGLQNLGVDAVNFNHIRQIDWM